MSEANAAAPGAQPGAQDRILFWGCFIALVTTAFGFITRMFLIGEWATEFNLDPAQAGRLAGIGIWPFAVSIIGFSLFIDKIGYKVSMVIAFLGHAIWSVMGVYAYFVAQDGDTDKAYFLLYWGSLILGLANGTVEAFINPVVATMFSKEKTKWLNILHAGWPGGLVVAGVIVIFMGNAPWGVKVGILAAPAVVYFLMLLPLKFPVQERVASGVSYREMLSEFGILGAIVVGFLVTLQLMDFFAPIGNAERILFIAIGVGIVVGFGVYTKALGSPLMFVLVLIMMPLATTEIGTDGWITDVMAGVAEGNFHPGWILVYTSAIMMVLRFFAGPIVHSLSPLGLLAVSAILAIVGLITLSGATAAMIFIAATLYGFGKTFFWPTMLGVVAEQTPKGGALTLNAISGIGMLAVGTLGFPYIGTLQADKQIEGFTASEAAEKTPGLLVNDTLTVLDDKHIYEIIAYKAINDAHLKELTTAARLFPEQAAAYDKAQYEKTFDKNEDGTLDADEKKAMDDDMKAKEEANNRKFDANKDGSLDDAEKNAMQDKMAKDAKDADAAWAMRWDADGNWADSGEKLSEAEKVKMMEDEQKRRAAWLAKFDENKDGSLSAEEYAAARKLGEELGKVRARSNQGALANMAIFPGIMLAGYLLLIVYFKSKGGYKAQVLTGHAAQDEEFTGGLEGPADQ